MFSSLAACRRESPPDPIRSNTLANSCSNSGRSLTRGRPMRLPCCRARSIPALTRSRWTCFLAGSSYQMVSPASGPGITGVLTRCGTQPVGSGSEADALTGPVEIRSRSSVARGGASWGVRICSRCRTSKCQGRREGVPLRCRRPAIMSG